jgi:transcriptional regulator with XRE-family HTH domain
LVSSNLTTAGIYKHSNILDKDMALKNRIRPIRERLGWTAKALAEKIGTTEQQICRLETGERKLSVEWLLSVCGALDVTADEIVDLPVKGIDKANADPVLIDSVVGFLIEACDKFKAKADKRQMAKWTTLVFTAVIELSLNVRQTRGLANLIVKSSRGD